jgi:hypothetical protein
MHRKILVTFCATLIVAFAARASTTISVPNTFVAGTPAKAADVNANFTAIVNGINAVMPPIVEDSAGHVVGPYLWFSNPLGGGTNVEGVFIRNSTASFVVQVDNTGFVSGGSLAYTTSDCTGTAYVFGAQQSTLLPFAMVLNNTAYVVQWSATTSVSVASETNIVNGNPQCSPVTPVNARATPVVATVDISKLGFVPPFSVR